MNTCDDLTIVDQSVIINNIMKTGLRFTVPGTDHTKVRSGVRPSKVILDQKTRERNPRKAKHKKRNDW